ncbi:MAG: hypothetical protein QXU93_05485 [Thermoproteus sp.]
MLWESLAAEISGTPPVSVTCNDGVLEVRNSYLLGAEFVVADYAAMRFETYRLMPGETARVQVSDCEKAAVHVRHPYRQFFPIYPRPGPMRHSFLERGEISLV